jgi:hypothetical protein
MTDKVGYQVSQFDANPNRGESVLSHLAEPPANAAAAEAVAIGKALEKGEGVVGNLTAARQRGLLVSHRDDIKTEWDSTSIAPPAGTPRAFAAPVEEAEPVADEAPAPQRTSRRAKAKS